MTPLEREERDRLVKLKDQKQSESNSKGETAIWRIRNGKVVNVQRKPEGASSQDARPRTG